MWWDPTASVVVLKTAKESASGLDPSTVDPSMSTTDPDAPNEPDVGVTMAVNETSSP